MRQRLYEALRTAAPRGVRGYVRGVYGATVCVRTEARSLPPLPPLVAPFSVRLMDAGDPREIMAWLEIQREGFGTPLDVSVFDSIVRCHPTYDVRGTYFLVEHDEPVGTISAAVYKAKPSVGVGHQAALVPRVRGKGLGLYLALFRYHSMAADGLQVLETETALFYRQAIRNHFRMGFRPKLYRDEWNLRDNARVDQHLLANFVLAGRYFRWKLRKPA